MGNEHRNEMNRQLQEWRAQEAAAWTERLTQGNRDDEKAYVDYLRASPRNVEEALIAQVWDDELTRLVDPNHEIDVDALLAPLGNIVEWPGVFNECAGQDDSPAWTSPADLLERAQSHGARSPVLADAADAQLHLDAAAGGGGRSRWLAIAAAFVAVTVAVLLLASPTLRQLWRTNEFTTSVGEQRAVELADGSVVALNTQSTVRIEFANDARDVFLDSGQAMFTVAKDAGRPFGVHAGGTIVQAVGTKFDVRYRAERISVAVVEGKVQVSSASLSPATSNGSARAAAPARLAAGEAMSVQSDGSASAPTRIDPAEIGAWQQRRLMFRDSTLAEIAEEFSRYNRTPQIRVEGEEIRARRFPVAVFDADDPESLITFLKDDDTLAIDEERDEVVIRQRPIIVQSSDVVEH